MLTFVDGRVSIYVVHGPHSQTMPHSTGPTSGSSPLSSILLFPYVFHCLSSIHLDYLYFYAAYLV